MARHNHVFLYAFVLKDPMISKDKEGNMFSAQVPLCVVQGNRSIGGQTNTSTDSFSFDCPPLLTQDPVLMMEISKWKANDIVLVKGNLCTRDTLKKSICPHCGQVNSYPGTVTYVSPIHCLKVKSCTTQEECIEDIKRNREISNSCIVVGNVCDSPKFYRYENGNCVTQYNIALNRKFHIKTDPASITTDYPHVKTYGEMAILDAKYIQVGASILIEGILHSRKFERQIQCQFCGEMYDKQDSAMEIIPYSVEYLAGCRDSKEIEEMQKNLADKEFEEIFGVKPVDPAIAS